MVRILVAKSTGVPETRFAVVAFVILLVSADANTSPGAPAVSWVTRSEDPAKLNVTVDPGFSFWKIVPISVNVAFSDAPANTVRVLGSAGTAAFGVAEELAAALLLVADVLLPEEQPATRVAT
jgi:hypothetical protein